MSEQTPEPNALTRRVSAEEREHAVKRLTAAFADDTIAVDEFERRVADVYACQTVNDLQVIVGDLPDPTAGVPAVAGESTTPAPIDRSSAMARRPFEQVRSVASSIERTVDGPVPECLDVRAIVGSVELDLRRADFPPGVTEIRVESILGSIEVELPEHVRVENDGHAFLANFSVRGRSRPRGDGPVPVVRITGRSILGNVEVELDD